MSYADSIQQLPSDVQTQVNAYLDEVDPSGKNNTERAIAFRALKGQAVMVESFASYEKANAGDSPKKGQHPHFAVSAPSHPKGSEGFFVGQYMLGETLSLRLPGAEWFDNEDKLLADAKAFFALVKMKGINPIIHAKSDSSSMLGLVYNYYKANCDESALKSLPECLVDYVKGHGAVYNQVLENGHAHYESLGISFDRTDKTGNKVRLSEDECFKLAMAAQTAINDIKKAKQQYDGEMPDVLAVVQSDVAGTHSVYDADNNRFIAVPSHKGSPANIQMSMISFLSNFPVGMQNAAYSIWGGYGRYEKYNGQKFDNLLASSTCTDSRTPPRVLLGRTDEEGLRFYALRAPGNSLADEKGEKLTLPAQWFFAITKFLGIQVAHAHHSSCGAMTAADAHLKGDGAALPGAFKELGDSRESTYAIVLTKGLTDEARVKWYKEKTGVKVENVADCLGLQQLMIDIAVAEKDPNGGGVHGYFLNTSEGQSYRYNSSPKAGKPMFTKVPTIPELAQTPSVPVHPTRGIFNPESYVPRG